MKAILLKEYGPPNKLKIGEVSKPIPKDDEVLVRVHSASINDWDWGLIRGNPFIIRLFFGLRKPKVEIPGVDISGKIEAVGKNVRSFSIGDDIFCELWDCGFGGFAEYVCVPENALSIKPANLSFNEAAALPHAGILAIQGLLNKAPFRPGEKILINGAGGGVGTLAIQMLQEYDVEVTGVDSGEKLEMMTERGFDHVIDYKKVDFTKTGKQYDTILDNKSFRSPFSYSRALKKNGTYITTGGSMPRLLQILLFGLIISPFTGKKLSVLSQEPNEGMDEITRLASAGKLKPVIDGPYSFKKIPELIQYFGEARHKGKIVVEIKK